MQLTSPAFQNGHYPLKYTKDGDDVSPPVQWSDLPEETRSLAVLLENITPSTQQPYLQWLAYDIPADLKELPEGVKHASEPQEPAPIRQGRNDLGNVGYDGPQGSVGTTYRYRLKLLALDQSPDIPAGAAREDFRRAISGHVLDEAELVAAYERPRPT